VRLKAGNAIGLFEVLFDRKSDYFYRLVNIERVADSFFIRKHNWKKVMSESQELGDHMYSFTKSVLGYYLKKIYLPI
jgi:hypothetical protein